MTQNTVFVNDIGLQDTANIKKYNMHLPVIHTVYKKSLYLCENALIHCTLNSRGNKRNTPSLNFILIKVFLSCPRLLY